MSIYACHPSFYSFHLLHNIANGCQIEIKAGNEWFEKKTFHQLIKIKSFLGGFEDLINFVSDQIQHIIEKWIKALHTKNMRKNISTFLVNAYKLKQIYMNLIDTSSSWKQEVWQSFFFRSCIQYKFNYQNVQDGNFLKNVLRIQGNLHNETSSLFCLSRLIPYGLERKKKLHKDSGAVDAHLVNVIHTRR